MRRIVRWLFDWRTGLTVCCSLVVALVLVVVVAGARTTHDALAARDRTSAAASRRIDMLNQRIEELTDEAKGNGARIGQLLDQINVLSEQVRRLGGRPVVTVVTEPRPSSSTSSTTPPRSTTTTTQPRRPPSTTTTTTPPRRTCIVGICLGGTR